MIFGLLLSRYDFFFLVDSFIIPSFTNGFLHICEIHEFFKFGVKFGQTAAAIWNLSVLGDLIFFGTIVVDF